MTEHDEQVRFVNWLDVMHITHHAIPNGMVNNAGKPNFAKMQYMRDEGFHAGFPDIIALVPRKNGTKVTVFIEMKKAKTTGKRGKLIGGGVVSAEQKEWLRELNECEETGAYVCHGADESIAKIKEIIG
jgi:hypothetical protein